MKGVIQASRFAHFLYKWHGLNQPQTGSSARERVIDQLQGYGMSYAELEARVLPARIADYEYGELDRLCEVGQLVWQGLERLSSVDGVIALYRPENLPKLAWISGLLPGSRYIALRNLLAEGACDFEQILKALGGFPPQALAVVWDLVWAGEVSNRRLLALQALQAEQVKPRRTRASQRGRRMVWPRQMNRPTGSVGEWFLLAGPKQGFAPQPERDRSMAAQLLQRWGIVGQRCLVREKAPSFSRLEYVFQELESAGEAIGGQFVEQLGPSQYASAAALETLDNVSAEDRAWMLAATDPANPYGCILPWPNVSALQKSPQRVVAARVILRDGRPIGYLSARGNDLTTFTASSTDVNGDAAALVEVLTRSARPGQPTLLRSVDGQEPGRSDLAGLLHDSGFLASRQGYIFRV